MYVDNWYLIFFPDVSELQNGTGCERKDRGFHSRRTLSFNVNFDHHHHHTWLHINARISRWDFSIYLYDENDMDDWFDFFPMWLNR